MARLEALEPDEGRIGEPAELDVQFIFVSDGYPYQEELPKVIKHPEGFTLVVMNREVPEEYAEEFLAQHPGAKLFDEKRERWNGE